MADPITLDIKKNLIKKQSCFDGLTDPEIERLADLLVEKHFKSGQIIVIEGDPVDSVYLIISGSATVQHTTSQNKQPQKIDYLATLGPDSAIGLNETGFYSLSGVRTATVIAREDMVTLCLGVALFHGFALANPHVSAIMRKHAIALLKSDKS